MRRFLDRLYEGALVASAAALMLIAALVLVQTAGRAVDRVVILLAGSPLGLAIPSLAEIGGFLFVGSVFLALAGTLRGAGHVRVTMLARGLRPAGRRALALVVLAFALGLGGFALWNSALQALDSWSFNAVSFGMVRIPLWIPQGVMTLGLLVFWIAILDEFLALARGGTPAFLRAEDDREAAGDVTDGH